jgi:pimeloyl-ACP methyl ester carboxylesterase
MNHERSGEGPPLVGVHGLGSNLRIWRPVRERLARHHELFAVDLPGFGESRPAAGRRGVRPLVDALEAWLDEQGLERPHLAGNSMGGRIVLELAARGRAASVVAISPAGFNSAVENRLIQANLMAQRAVTRRLAPAADAVMTSAAARTAVLAVAVARPWRLTRDQAADIVRDYARAPGFRAVVGDVVWGKPEDLDRVTCPVTVLWGTRDLILPVTGAARARERIPGARVERLAGLGHIPTFDAPDTVASAMLETTGGST